MNAIVESLKAESNINIINKTTLFERRFVKVVLYEYTKWDSPDIHEYESIERVKVSDIVAALTVTEDQKVVLINQFRIPQGRFCIESPAWLQDKKDETLEETARREILEETWYAPWEMIYVGKTPTSSGLTSETIDCYVWLNCKKVSDVLELDNAEDIQVLEVPLSEMDDFVEAIRKKVGLTIDSKVLFMLWEYKKLIAKKLTDG
ncbi:MAG: MutT-like protein [uncultured bacterium (gcode 4)]|uniref:MutT-like protein n=1 Tax=uncultured bacterium (gcode 4) TaxID=1234023 RepID=K2GWG6_9BACT|nr:MAG: MutT-like protein [uncultured bacterium (gcode 4)]